MKRVAVNAITAQRAMYQEIAVPVRNVANSQVAINGAGPPAIIEAN